MLEFIKIMFRFYAKYLYFHIYILSLEVNISQPIKNESEWDFLVQKEMFQNLITVLMIIRATQNHKAKFMWHINGFQSWMNMDRSFFLYIHIYYLILWVKTNTYLEGYISPKVDRARQKRTEFNILTLIFPPVFSWIWSDSTE